MWSAHGCSAKVTAYTKATATTAHSRSFVRHPLITRIRRSIVAARDRRPSCRRHRCGLCSFGSDASCDRRAGHLERGGMTAKFTRTSLFLLGTLIAGAFATTTTAAKPTTIPIKDMYVLG